MLLITMAFLRNGTVSRTHLVISSFIAGKQGEHTQKYYTTELEGKIKSLDFSLWEKGHDAKSRQQALKTYIRCNR